MTDECAAASTSVENKNSLLGSVFSPHGGGCDWALAAVCTEIGRAGGGCTDTCTSLIGGRRHPLRQNSDAFGVSSNRVPQRSPRSGSLE